MHLVLLLLHLLSVPQLLDSHLKPVFVVLGVHGHALVVVLEPLDLLLVQDLIAVCLLERFLQPLRLLPDLVDLLVELEDHLGVQILIFYLLFGVLLALKSIRGTAGTGAAGRASILLFFQHLLQGLVLLHELVVGLAEFLYLPASLVLVIVVG